MKIKRNSFLYITWLLSIPLGILLIVKTFPLFLAIILGIIGTFLVWHYLPMLLIYFVAFIPFQPALNPSPDFDLASSRILIVFFAVVGVCYWLIKKKAWFNLSNLTLLIIIFLFLSLISGWVALDKERFIRKLIVFFSIFPLYFLLLSFLKETSSWKKIFTVWCWTAFIISLIGLSQFIFQFIGGKEIFFTVWGKYVAPILFGFNTGESIVSNPSWFVGIGNGDWLRAISVFPDPHMLAFYLGMSIPIQVMFALTYSRKQIFKLQAFTSLLALLLTFSRGSYVGLVGILIFFTLRYKNYFWEKRYYFAGTIIILSSLLFVIAPIRERFISILDVGEGSNKDRLAIWNDAAKVSLENPLLGVGLGNYANTVRPEAKYREPIYAHNTYLDISSEIGMFGSLTWILIIAWAMIPLIEFIKPRATYGKHDHLLFNLDMGVGLAILWFSLHCLFETPIFSPQILPLLMYLLAFRVFFDNFSISSKLS